jgi:hypothetical protein
MTAVVYEFRDLMFITYPSIEIIGVKAAILLDHLLFRWTFFSPEETRGHIVHGCDTNLLYK